MKRVKYGIVVHLILALVLARTALPGTTGKIAGSVIEKDTRAPIPGANIIVIGTLTGAATDINGNYSILNVPPGNYEVKAMVMGYTDMTVSDVRVRIDQTARVNFSLETEVIEGQVVTVVADRNIVKPDVATSVGSFSADEMETLPMDNLEEVVGLQAGVEAGLVIRGGGAEEALFQMDGITLRDPRNNQPITGVALSSVQEVSIERGGFNAEYGQVRSGIVNVVTKEGKREKYHGSFLAKYSPASRKYFGISPYDPNATMLRPYLDPTVCWTGTKNGDWDEYTWRQYPEFIGWNNISRQLVSDSDPTNDLSPAAAQQLFKWQHRRRAQNDQPDYNIDAGFGGPVPFIGDKLGNLRFFTSYRTEREMLLVPLSRPDYKDSYWSLKLNSDINTSMKLTLSGMIGKSYHVARNEAGLDNNALYIRSPEQVAAQIANLSIPRATDSRLFCDSYFSAGNVGFQSFSAKLTHILSVNTYYDASIEHIYRKYLTEPIGLRDTTMNVQYIPGLFTNESPFGFSPIHDPGIDGMLTGGHTSTLRDYSRISSTTLKFDISSQINFNNLAKAGFEFVYSDLNLDYGEIKEIYVDGNMYTKKRKFPIRGALYIQDKLELEGLVVNAGVRLDYSNANTSWPSVDVWDKSFFSSNYLEGSSFETEKAKSVFSFSPRLGISHPITENSKLFFNYGHFKQLPTYEQMFRLSRGGSNEIQGFGDPSLIPEKTIAYELGYDHSLYDTYLIQLAGFYRDISDQRDYTTYISADRSINYLKTANNSYEDIRGFELTLQKPVGTWWTVFINYTYQVNTLGHFGTSEVYQDPREQREYDRNTRALYQERPIPQPYARSKFSFYTPADFGPKTLGIHPLGDWNLNVIADWRAGEWVTWNPSRKLNVAQNVKSKDWHNVQLRLSKMMHIPKMKITFFVDMNNALNTKRLSLNSFYDGDDYKFYFGSLHLPQSADYDNIIGDDKVGDYRKEGVPYQPIEKVGNINTLTGAEINPRVIYLNNADGKYMNYIDGNWSEVDSQKMEKVLDDKAYIDMPNHTYFNFLNPRRIFFGLKVSFDL